MNPILKNVLASLAGLVVMMAINVVLVMLLGSMIPPPEGVDIKDIDSINDNLHRYSTFQLVMPFIAHAGGTLAGCVAATKIASSHKLLIVMILAAVHLAGGYMMISMLSNSPMWFNMLDLGLAYFPMAFLAYKLFGGNKKPNVSSETLN